MLGAKYFMAVSSGALITSVGLYLGYNEWHPMVWAAMSVTVAHLIIHFGRLLDGKGSMMP